MTDLAEDRFGIGGNSPPDDITLLGEHLSESTEGLVKRKNDLLAAVERAPAEITDDIGAGKMADLIKLIGACMRTAETGRTSAKEPFLAASRLVDGFFKKITEPLGDAKAVIERRLTLYQRNKAEAERRERERLEQLAREVAAKAAEEAAQRAATIKTDDDLDEAITAEAIAEQSAADAIEATKAATASNAEMSRSRGDLGSVASLRTEWIGEITDRATLDLETLRPHIAVDALEKAIRAYVRAGGRELRGAKIYQQSKSVVR